MIGQEESVRLDVVWARFRPTEHFGRIAPVMEGCPSGSVEGSFRHRPSPSAPPPGLKSRALQKAQPSKTGFQANRFFPKAPRNKSIWRFVRSMKEKILSPVRN
jgi:hypothetical protein